MNTYVGTIWLRTMNMVYSVGLCVKHGLRNNKIKEILGISDHSYKTWFSNMKIAYLKDQEIGIQTKHCGKEVTAYLNEKYQERFEMAVDNILGTRYRVKFL